VKSCTKAGTGCGGCSNLLKQVVDQTLADLGVEADKGLCEHLAYGRQELYHLARVGELKSFEALRDKHGQGLGCDICKSTVASILASLWNEHVLEKPHRALQDTNDAFLANLQKDGTYSVVPRIPGGDHPGGAHHHRRSGAQVRPLHQDHRRPAHRSLRRPGRPAARHLGRAGGGGL
jgi:nitrite reductase (NADH) large subunit